MQDYEQQVNGVGHLVAKLSTETTNSTNDLETRLQVHMKQIALLCYVFCSCLLTYQQIDIINTNHLETRLQVHMMIAMSMIRIMIIRNDFF